MVVEFLPGNTYYWRARELSPLYSPWSETRSFSVNTHGVASGARVSIDAPNWVPAGYDFTVPVDISDAVVLAEASYDISFDSSVISLNDVTGGEVNGTAVPVTSWSEDSGTVTISQSIESPGVSGSGQLAILHFSATGSVGDSTDITLSNGALTDDNENTIEGSWVGDSVELLYLQAGDVNGDGEVNALDITKLERIIAGLP